MRGGGGRSNYDSVNVKLCEDQLSKAKLAANIVVDCSHGNSMKDHNLQSLVLENCTNQILEGNRSIVGVMLESNIEAGNQAVPKDLSQLKYGVSVTDACVDWTTTESMIREMRNKLQAVVATR